MSTRQTDMYTGAMPCACTNIHHPSLSDTRNQGDDAAANGNSRNPWNRPRAAAPTFPPSCGSLLLKGLTKNDGDVTNPQGDLH